LQLLSSHSFLPADIHTKQAMVSQHLHLSSTALFADDASVSSTISVDHQIKELSASSSSSKRVTFNMSLDENHDNKNVICEEDCRNLWYRSSDYQYFKRATFNEAKAIIDAESKNRAPYSYRQVLEHTYHQLCHIAISECDEYQSLSTTVDHSYLNRWAEVAPSRIGMERWAVRSIAKDKSMRRFEIVDIVLSSQDAHSNQQPGTQEAIRKSCERISRPGRLFAVALAQAQAAALLKEESKEDFFA
jgi:hypothetical protein